MRPLAVVDPQPGVGQRPELRHGLKEMGIEDLGAIAAIEPFDIGILVRLPGLDVVNRHAVRGAPVDEGLAGKLGAVIDADGRRTAMDGDELGSVPGLVEIENGVTSC